MKFETIAGVVVLAVVAGGVAVGFATIGPPQHMRLVSLDRRRVDDLRSIALDFRNGEHGQGATRLPPRLNVTDDPNSSLRDPATGKPYEYQRESASRYRLCATFDLADSAYGEGGWQHGAGRQCFEFDVAGPAEPLARPSPAGKR